MKRFSFLLAVFLLAACTRTLPVQSLTETNITDAYVVQVPWRKMAHCMEEYLEGHMTFGELDNPSDISFRPAYSDDRVSIVTIHASTRVAVISIAALDHSKSKIDVRVYTADRPFLSNPVRNHTRQGVKACAGQ